MRNILPANIVDRKDKLGHSIPLKNWIRDNKKVKEFVLDHVFDAVIVKRGYFNKKFIDILTKDHMAKRRNNSHRLWALTVLEIWLREHFDK